MNGFLILKLLIIHLLNFRRMAIFNSYLLGKAKKSVGNITLCYRNLKNIAQAKVFSRRDNPTPEVLDQRARVRVLGKLGRRLLPAVRKGFVGVGDGTTSNAFMSENMGAVEVTAERGALDRVDLLVTVMRNRDSRTLRFEDVWRYLHGF